MKRLLICAWLVLLSASIANPQSIPFPGPGGVASSVATVSLTYHVTQDAAHTTYTFTAAAIGSAAADRCVVVGVGGVNGSSRTISSVTIGGVSATSIAFVEGSGGGAFVPSGLFAAVVPTGTTGDVVVTYSGAASRASIGVWAAYNVVACTTPTDTVTSVANPQTGLIDISAGGIAIGYSHVFGAGSPTFTWTNLTENFDEVVGVSAGSQSGASAQFAGAQTNLAITATPTAFTAAAMVVGSFR